MDKLEQNYLEERNKKAKRGGKYTKIFLKWNRDQLRKGLTTFYGIKEKIYNPKRDSFITLKYKKSGTKNKILTKKSASINRVNNVIVSDYKKVRLNEANVPSDLNKSNSASFFKKLVKKFNLFGKTTKWFLMNNKNKNVLYEATLPAIQEGELNKFFKSYPVFLDEVYSPYSGYYYHYYVVYSEFVDAERNGEDDFSNYEANYDDFDLFITENVNISRNVVSQTFNDGGYCLLNPIHAWLKDKLESSKNKSTKKKYQARLNKFYDITQKSGVQKIGYFTKYKNGIPDSHLSTLCNDLQIHIKIQKPFCDNIYLNIKPTKKALKTFAFTNTRLNHVELTGKDYFNNIFTDNYKDDVTILNSYEEMNNLKQSLKVGEWIATRSKNGYTTIKTLDTIYKVDDSFNKACKEFEEEIGCNSSNSCWAFDSIKHPQLSKFIDQGTHFNGTCDFSSDMYEVKQCPLNPNDEIVKVVPIDSLKEKGLKHYDQKKAYANFYKTKFYDGFMSRPAEFRKTDNYDQKGLYLIDNIVINNDKFKKYNDKLNWFKNNNIYTDAELKALKHYGATFDVICGAMGNKVDFRFNDTMKNEKILLHKINNKEVKLPYYSKWVGRCAMNNESQRFVMGGQQQYFENIKTEKTEISYNELIREATISYPKRSCKTMKHIAAQITAYQRLVMLEQLMNMDYDKILRVCVDGVYFYDHDCNFDMDIWDDKYSKMTFGNSETENYLSNIYGSNKTISEINCINEFNDEDDELRNIIQIPEANKRTYYRTEAHQGGGGTGKTTSNMLDSGFIDICYIAPSWKLSIQMKKDFKEKFNQDIDVNVYHRLLYKPYNDILNKKYVNFLLDEGSQVTEHDKKQIFNLKAYRLIFCGDWGYQLPPAIDRKKFPLSSYPDMKEMTLEGFDNIVKYTELKRAKCKHLKLLLKTIREFIDHKVSFSDLKNMLKRHIKTINLAELKQIYKKEDMILCSENVYKNEYTKLFEYIEKFYILENTSYHQNGEIVYLPIPNTKYELRHGYTIHSIQGETAKSNIFIDMRKQKSLRMLYTAISRAQYIDQLFLI